MITTSVDREQGAVRTHGAEKYGLYNLIGQVSREEYLPHVKDYLLHLIRFQTQYETKIQPNQTVGHGYWLAKFIPHEHDDLLHAWELTADTERFVYGMDLMFDYWTSQKQLCDDFNAPFDPPTADKMVAVSAGVLSGNLPIEGVRYDEPGSMSGWFLTTDLYNGDVKSLDVLHLYHVTSARPELAPYIALPPGFRFYWQPDRKSGEAWFDPEVLQED